jgi:hypothetical protein
VLFQHKKIPGPELESALEAVLAAGPHKLLLLHADKSVPYETLETAMDMAKRAGVQEVRLVPKRRKPPETAEAPLPMKAQATMTPRPLSPPAQPLPPDPLPTGPAASETGTSMSAPQSGNPSAPVPPMDTSSGPLPPTKPGGDNTAP